MTDAFYSPLVDDIDRTLSPDPLHPNQPLLLCGSRFKIARPYQFLAKNLFIIFATYLFIPIIALHDDGDIGGIAYASILIAIHVLFIVIYFWRVKFLKLDKNNRQLAARVLGLVFCVMLLGLVAGNLDEDLGMLAVELLGLCLVHSAILLLVTIEVNVEVEGKGDSDSIIIEEKIAHV